MRRLTAPTRRRLFATKGCARRDRSQKMVVSVKAISCDSCLLVSDYEHFVRHF
jgi:hypothetical protein